MVRFLLMMLLLTNIASGQLTKAAKRYRQGVNKQICDRDQYDRAINCRVINSWTNAGTATCIGPDPRDNTWWLFLTCNHVTEGRADIRQVELAPGKWWGARILKTDKKLDLTLLAVRSNVAFPYVKLCDITTTTASKFIGYPGGISKQVVREATLLGKDKARIEGEIGSGDSGGYLVDTEDRLVGIVWGSRGNDHYTDPSRFTNNREAYRFVSQWFGRRYPNQCVPIIPRPIQPTPIGKDYTKDIKDLNDRLDKHTEAINQLIELINNKTDTSQTEITNLINIVNSQNQELSNRLTALENYERTVIVKDTKGNETDRDTYPLSRPIIFRHKQVDMKKIREMIKEELAKEESMK